MTFRTAKPSTVRAEQVIAQTLKRLYPQNPDIVLGREARIIMSAFTDAGLRIYYLCPECSYSVTHALGCPHYSDGLSGGDDERS